MLVTVSKSGTKDRLLVDLIDVYLVSPDKKKDKDILERFQCKNYDIGGSKLPKQTVKCQNFLTRNSSSLFPKGREGNG